MQVLRDLGEIEFVNADSIAKGLSPFHPEAVSIEAGKLMLSRMEFLLAREQDFGFESTLASKNFSRIINKARVKGCTFHLIFCASSKRRASHSPGSIPSGGWWSQYPPGYYYSALQIRNGESTADIPATLRLIHGLRQF
ncbi:MAG: hypothetical protein CMN76_11400 [Spirochaetaceae bacterium]|nr:hypothetical protein [Spirochaetaceae bacterium]